MPIQTPIHIEGHTQARWLWALLMALLITATACGSSETEVAASAIEGEESIAEPDATEPSVAEEAEPSSDDGESHDDDQTGSEQSGDDAGNEDAEDDAAPQEPDDDEGDDEETDSDLDVTEATAPEIGDVVAGGSSIPPGTYRLNVLGEDWGLTIDDESLLFGGSDPEVFGFGTEALADTNTNLWMLKTVGIVPPREVGVHQEHEPLIPDVTIDIPADLGTWLDAVPQIVVTESGAETVAGGDARWYRLAVDPAAGQTFHCPFSDHCTGFVVSPKFGTTVVDPTIDVTVWQLSVLPDVMPWVQVEDSTSVEQAQEAMRKLLAGLARA
ncbi:MAG: hypothetical protein HKN94_00080 [Acidimicrobiales bacterium]|nr:hypothetical protein [Acidimicrobiales bacterium]RZV45887.1 MAG: hypothetical protein EX269_08655 [Acidimicrobiales bacterium]